MDARAWCTVTLGFSLREGSAFSSRWNNEGGTMRVGHEGASQFPVIL